MKINFEPLYTGETSELRLNRNPFRVEAVHITSALRNIGNEFGVNASLCLAYAYYINCDMD